MPLAEQVLIPKIKVASFIQDFSEQVTLLVALVGQVLVFIPRLAPWLILEE